MADGSFFAETERLEERVGHGVLEGSVTVDQVYALYQHEGADFKHPRGGEAFYLRRPLLEGQDSMLGAFSAVFETDATCVGVMVLNMEDLADAIPIRAPVEFVVLRQSAAPMVVDNGEVAYYRSAPMPRLTQEQLNAIRRVGEPIINPAEWLRQWHYRRGEGGHSHHPGARAL